MVLAAAGCLRRLVAVQRWPLGVGGLVWVDVGELRSMGLGTIPLRTLVLGAAVWLVLVSRSIWIPALLVAGSGCIFRLWPRRRFWIRVRQCRLGSARPARAIQSLVGSRILRERLQ